MELVILAAMILELVLYGRLILTGGAALREPPLSGDPPEGGRRSP